MHGNINCSYIRAVVMLISIIRKHKNNAMKTPFHNAESTFSAVTNKPRANFKIVAPIELVKKRGIKEFKPNEITLGYLGLTNKRYHKLMKGSENMTISEAAKLCNYFNWDLNDLIEVVETTKPVISSQLEKIR